MTHRSPLPRPRRLPRPAPRPNLPEPARHLRTGALLTVLTPALALLISSCAQHSGSTAPSQTNLTAPTGITDQPTAAGASSAGVTRSAPPPLDDAAGPDQVPIQSAQPDPDSAQAALDRATAFLRAFGRTDLPQQAWWDGVSGYFTPAAAAAYQATDVANVPLSSVTDGSAALLPDSTKYRAEVAVGTDAGTYTVVLVRTDQDWLVDRAVPPR